MPGGGEYQAYGLGAAMEDDMPASSKSSGSVTPDLLARVARELGEVYEDIPFMQPSPADVVRGVLAELVIELHDDAREIEGCTKVDDCTAKAIVLRAVANWLSEMAKGVEG